MLWFILLVVLVGASVFAANRALWNSRAFAHVSEGFVPQALVYAAAVAFGAAVSGLITDIQAAWDPGLGASSTGLKFEAIARIAANGLAAMAWQTGLLIAAAFVTARASRTPSSA
ncbi:MAG: hypothetical protein V9E83_13230 [Baekduia sp.]